MKDKRDNTTATKKLDEQPTRSSSADVDGRVFHPTTYDLTLLCRASFHARLIEGDKQDLSHGDDACVGRRGAKWNLPF